MSDPVEVYRTRVIDELEFLVIISQKNDGLHLIPGLERAIALLEDMET